MKIAVIAHIRHPIAEPFMGGMESHCHQLVTALTRRGHDVTLFAARGCSLPQAQSICDQPYEQVLPWKQWHGTRELADYQDAAFAQAWNAVRDGQFDVVHNNALFPPLIEWSAAEEIAMVTSQHVPPFGAMRATVRQHSHCDWQRFTVTSYQQLGLWDGCNLSNFAVVHNGIDTDKWPVAKTRSNRLVWFGRITENKGLREAVQAARLSGIPMDIIGMVEDETYFADAVAPSLSENIRYLGHMMGHQLRECVAGALAAVVTPLWDEPFGLVAAEAMSCGVPVIAFDRGAMREVLGDCGILVPGGDIVALAEAMADATRLDGQSCRQRIENHFSVDRMLDGYEDCYRAVIERVRSGASSSRDSSQSRTVAELA